MPSRQRDLAQAVSELDKAQMALSLVEDMVTDHLKTGHPVVDIAHRLMELTAEVEVAFREGFKRGQEAVDRDGEPDGDVDAEWLDFRV